MIIKELLLNKLREWLLFIMILFITLIRLTCSQTNTTINTCANEKKVLKLDIRLRVSQLADGSTIEDIDAYALC